MCLYLVFACAGAGISGHADGYQLYDRVVEGSSPSSNEVMPFMQRQYDICSNLTEPGTHIGSTTIDIRSDPFLGGFLRQSEGHINDGDVSGLGSQCVQFFDISASCYPSRSTPTCDIAVS